MAAEDPQLFVELMDRQLRQARRIGAQLTLVLIVFKANQDPKLLSECRRRSDWIGRLTDDLVGILLFEATYLDGLDVAHRVSERLIAEKSEPTVHGIATFPQDGASVGSLLRSAQLRARAHGESPLLRMKVVGEGRWRIADTLLGDEEAFESDRLHLFGGRLETSTRTRRALMDIATLNAIDSAVLRRLELETNRWAATFLGSENWAALANAPKATKGSRGEIVAPPGNAPEWLSEGWHFVVDESAAHHRALAICAATFAYALVARGGDDDNDNMWRVVHSSDRTLVEALWAEFTLRHDPAATGPSP